jgi:hypothetical protein
MKVNTNYATIRDVLALDFRIMIWFFYELKIIFQNLKNVADYVRYPLIS